LNAIKNIGKHLLDLLSFSWVVNLIEDAKAIRGLTLEHLHHSQHTLSLTTATNLDSPLLMTQCLVAVALSIALAVF
jgi:hypothetical protein